MMLPSEKRASHSRTNATIRPEEQDQPIESPRAMHREHVPRAPFIQLGDCDNMVPLSLNIRFER